MEWLKDKKNLPIVAVLGGLVLLLAIAAILFETGVIGGSGQAASPDATATAPAAPPPGPSAAPAPNASATPAPAGPSGAIKPGGPGAQAAAPAIKVPVNVAKGPDPFAVSGVKPAPKTVRVVKQPQQPINTFVPSADIASNGNIPGGGQITPGTNSTPPPLSIPNIRLTPEESQSMRVSGVVLTNGSGVRAVLEANGQSLTVQPGDAVPGGRVISIQTDGLTMKADDGSVVHVPISTGNPQGG